MSDRTAPAPYVGVSGFMSRAEVDAALKCWTLPRPLKIDPPERFPPNARHLMVGVLASSKTIAGQANSYPRRYPRRDDIAGIFSYDPRCLNLVHYATGGERDAGRLERDLVEAMRLGGKHCHGLQVNAAWPPPSALAGFRAAFSRARLVLQLGPGAMACMDGDPLGIARRVASEYGSSVTDVLVDVSGGRGMAIDPGNVRQIVAYLRGAGPWTVGVAGGLCAETLPAAALLIRDHDLSIDAEGRLRDDADGGGNLDLDKVRAYLNAAHSFLGEPWSV